MPALQYSLAVESMFLTKPSRSLEHITLVNLDAAKSLLISDEFAASRTFTAPTRGEDEHSDSGNH